MRAAMDYDALAGLCARRRSVRRFSGEPVTREDIGRILAVAKTSPYASGRANWEVVVVQDRETIAAMAKAVKVRAQELSLTIRDDMREHFADYSAKFAAFETAPLLLVPCFRMTKVLSMMQSEPEEEIVRLERDSCVKSISCVTMLILLAAESLGLGACYMTGPLLAEPALARILGLNPGRAIGAVVPVGHCPEGDGDGEA